MIFKIVRYDLQRFVLRVYPLAAAALLCFLMSRLLGKLPLPIFTEILTSLVTAAYKIILRLVLPIISIVHYYESMYGRYAVQTHSLPIKGTSLFFAKWLATMLSGGLSTACCSLLNLGSWNNFAELSIQMEVGDRLMKVNLPLLATLASILFYVSLITLILCCLNVGRQQSLRHLGWGGFLLMLIGNTLAWPFLMLASIVLFPLSVSFSSDGSFHWVFRSMLPEISEAIRRSEAGLAEQAPQIFGVGGIFFFLIFSSAIYYLWASYSVQRRLFL